MEQPAALCGVSLWLAPLGFPRGEAVSHDGSSEPAGLTDEGWRWLKVLDFPVEWRKLKQMPFIWVHSLTNLSPPLISLFCQSVPKCRLSKNPASPRGKPRTQKQSTVPFNGALCCVSFGSASCRPLQWLCSTIGTRCSPQNAPIPHSLLLLTYAHAGGRCRAGLGSTISVQTPQRHLIIHKTQAGDKPHTWVSS